MARLTRSLLAILSLLLLSMPAQAQTAAEVEQRARDIVAVWQGAMPYEDVFAPEFIAQVPPARFDALRVQLTSQAGALVGLDSFSPARTQGGGTIALRFENAIVSGPIQLSPDAPHKVMGMLLNNFAPVNDTGLTVAQQLEALPGITNMLFASLDGSQVIAQHNPDRQLGIGSSFKLYVLSALSRQIAAGQRRWDDVVTLDEHSFPSGQMQNWPLGSPLTLHTLATMMISISDNTAADQLIAVLGRDAVENELHTTGNSNPAASIPFMTTRELFTLKAGDDASLAQYAAAGVAERRAMLDAREGRDMSLEQVGGAFTNGPRAIDVEWFASPRDLAHVLDGLKDDPVVRQILAVNLGVEREAFAGWDYAGYKGGSEPGVLNFSWLLRDHEGTYWVLSMGWNNPAASLSEVQLLALAQAALAEAGAH